MNKVIVFIKYYFVINIYVNQDISMKIVYKTMSNVN